MKRIFFALVLMVPMRLFAQEFVVSADFGYAQAGMSGLHKYQNDLIASGVFPYQAVSSYPSYWGYAGQAGIKIRRSQLGLVYGYNSTVSQTDYADVSSYAYYDMRLHAHSLGVFYLYRLNKSENWPIYISVSPRMIATTISVSTSQHTGAVNQSSASKYLSTNLGLQTSLVLEHKMENYFFRVSAGYEAEKAGSLYLNGDHGSPLTWKSSNLSADWSGLRANASVGIYLHAKKGKE